MFHIDMVRQDNTANPQLYSIQLYYNVWYTISETADHQKNQFYHMKNRRKSILF